jgi:hypothetical protein
VSGLSVDGQSVTVTGSGFDLNKGVYVSLCVVPPTNYAPSPCGGGQDRSGTSGASVWVSTNPPDYAVGLTTPYGEGGSFSVPLTVGPAINDTIDCRSVRCAIVTRNDHTRGSDRSQDLFLPVTFGSDASPPSAPVAATPTTPTTSAPVPAPAADVPVDSTTATAEPTSTVEAPKGTALVADEDDGGSGSGTALAIGGGAALAAVAAVLGVRAKRRRAIAPEA